MKYQHVKPGAVRPVDSAMSGLIANKLDQKVDIEFTLRKVFGPYINKNKPQDFASRPLTLPPVEF